MHGGWQNLSDATEGRQPTVERRVRCYKAPMHERAAYHSKVAYVHLAAVVVVSALIVLVWGSAAGGAIVAAVGLAWVLLIRRSGIDVTDDGFKVRGLLRTKHLGWSEADAFIVVGFSGQTRSLLTTRADFVAVTRADSAGGSVDGPTAVTNEALTSRVHVLSLVAVVTSQGERIKVPGTASSPLDPTFPADAAAELNRALKRNNPAATAS
jgi:hypothetical protein